ncbi:MAG: hypothetical protein ACTHJQ_22035 [Rhizobiaceae bacterium]
MTKDKSYKITVCFEERPGGGLRAWSDDVPGLVLSHTDVDAVLSDVTSALKTILSHRFGRRIEVRPLPGIREALENEGIVPPAGFSPGPKDYVATCH